MKTLFYDNGNYFKLTSFVQMIQTGEMIHYSSKV